MRKKDCHYSNICCLTSDTLCVSCNSRGLSDSLSKGSLHTYLRRGTCGREAASMYNRSR